jgi:hypothetical protein
MMKVMIKLPSGLELSFEGDEPSFDRFTTLLTDMPGFVETLGVNQLPPPPGGNNGGGKALAPLTGNSDDPLDPKVLGDRLARVGATSDIERVTVIAQAGIEAGMDGMDFATAERIYDALALRKPAKWKAAFGNAKTKGYMQSAGAIGRWKPTVPGENFAKGHGPVSPAKKRTPRREVAAAAPVHLLAGGSEQP